MKSVIRFLFFAVLAISVLSACKKKDTEGDAYNKAIVKLLGKWTFVSASTNDHYSGADHINSLPGQAGDYMEFGNSGKANLRIFGANDISEYTLVGDSKLIFDDVDQFDIKVLSETELVFNRRTVYSSAAFKEETYSLKK
jgi:hypothetical protein